MVVFIGKTKRSRVPTLRPVLCSPETRKHGEGNFCQIKEIKTNWEQVWFCFQMFQYLFYCVESLKLSLPALRGSRWLCVTEVGPCICHHRESVPKHNVAKEDTEVPDAVLCCIWLLGPRSFAVFSSLEVRNGKLE